LEKLRIRSAAKSSKLHPPKNLRGGLRGATRGWHLKPKPHHLLRCYNSATPLPQRRKIKQIAPAEKSCVVGCDVVCGVGA